MTFWNDPLQWYPRRFAIFYLIAYLAASYFVITVILLAAMAIINAVSRLRKWQPAFGEHGRYQKAMTAAWLVGLLLPFAPYGAVAAQTVMFGDTFRSLVKQALADGVGNPNDPIVVLRVLKITPQSAKVYIVQSFIPNIANEKVGLVIDFSNTRRGWQYQSCDCVWSDVGSAHSNTFPPYWEGF